MELKIDNFERCWRYERPQAGRYREFFQFGLEAVNPDSDGIRDELIALAEQMVRLRTMEYVLASAVKRGLDYYTADGFELAMPELGAQKQVVGGGTYPQGIGFAIGFDRLMLCRPAQASSSRATSAPLYTACTSTGPSSALLRSYT